MKKMRYSPASLEKFRNDIVTEILKLPDELGFLRQAIVDGEINGSVYTGSCACLAGTLARACGNSAIQKLTKVTPRKIANFQHSPCNALTKP